MSSNEVRGELGAQLLESVDGVWRQPTKPNSCRTLQRRREGSTHDLVWYSLEVHQSFEGFQVIEGVLNPVVAFNLWHAKFLWQGKGIDGGSKQ